LTTSWQRGNTEIATRTGNKDGADRERVVDGIQRDNTSMEETGGLAEKNHIYIYIVQKDSTGGRQI
jgi:hypothetical protein